MKKIKLSLTLFCIIFVYSVSLIAQTLNESFESTTFPPDKWKVINGGAAQTWTYYATNPISGTASASIRWDGTAHNDWLITPKLIPGTESHSFSFKAKNQLSSLLDQFNLKISTTGNSESDFTILLASAITPSSSITSYTYDLSAYIGQPIYIAFQAISADKYRLFIDDVVGPQIFDTTNQANPATLISPINLSTNNNNDITLRWNTELNVTGNKLFLGTDNPPTNMINNLDLGNQSSFATILQNETQYFWKVVPYNDVSIAESCPVWTFSTKLNTSTLPFVDDFEESSLKWNVVNGNASNKWYHGVAAPYEGNYSIYISNNNGVSNNYASLSSIVHFYRDFQIPDSCESVTLKFKYRGVGEYLGYQSYYDYLKVSFLDIDNEPVSGSLNLPFLTSVNFCLESQWVEKTIDVPLSFSGTTKRLLFTWVNDTATYNQPPAAIDNIQFIYSRKPNPAMIVSPPNNNIYTPQIPVLKWAYNSIFQIDSCKVYLGTDNPPGNLTNGVLLSNTLEWSPSFPLQSNTQYFWKIVPIFRNNEADNCPVWSFTTDYEPTTLPFVDDFDTLSPNWCLANTNQLNKWCFGSATSYSNQNSMYISATGGVANEYVSQSSISHFSRAFAFPDSVEKITLSFYYKVEGEHANGPYDYLQIFLMNEDFIPIAGTLLPYGNISTPLWQFSSWTKFSLDLPLSYSGTVKKLVFSWINDSTLEFQPPAAIDQLTITSYRKPPNATIVFPQNGAVNLDFDLSLEWGNSTNSDILGYKLYFGISNPPVNELNVGLNNTWTPSVPLANNTQYYWKVVPYNSYANSDNCPVWTFRTKYDESLPLILTNFIADISLNNVRVNWICHSEQNMLGYYVYRSDSADLSLAIRLNNEIIPSQNSNTDYHYSWTDYTIEADHIYFYWLMSVERNSSFAYHGPVQIKTDHTIDQPPIIPLTTSLNSPYPNPFNPSTIVSFNLAQPAHVNLEIYNIKGQLVKLLTNQFYQEGKYSILWEGKDSYGNVCGTGVYLLKFSAGQMLQMKKMMLMK